MFKAAFYKGSPKKWHVRFSAWAIRKVTRGPYSHCELAFSDGWAASASLMDGGVRFKQIDFNPEHWDFVELPQHLERPARLWFQHRAGTRYDIWGTIRFLIGVFPDSKRKDFCSECVAAALGIKGSWQFHPNGLFWTLSWAARQSG